MKTALEKLGKLAAKTKRASERNMVGPTPVPLEVLESILEIAAGQGAVVERLEALEGEAWPKQTLEVAVPTVELTAQEGDRVTAIEDRLDGIEELFTAKANQGLPPASIAGIRERFPHLEEIIGGTGWDPDLPRPKPEERVIERLDVLRVQVDSIIRRVGDRLDRRFASFERRAQSLETAIAAPEDAEVNGTLGERVVALEEKPPAKPFVAELEVGTEKAQAELERIAGLLGGLEERFDVLEGKLRGALDDEVPPSGQDREVSS